MTLTVCAGLFAAVAFLHLQFGSTRNVEIRSARRTGRHSDREPILSQTALRFLRIES